MFFCVAKENFLPRHAVKFSMPCVWRGVKIFDVSCAFQGGARHEYHSHDYGAGFSARYLRAFRKFYIIMPDMEIWKSRFPNLTWTHIFRSLRVGDDTAIRWYLQMASQEIPRMGNGDKGGGVQGLQRTHKHLHSPRVVNKRNRWKPVFQT